MLANWYGENRTPQADDQPITLAATHKGRIRESTIRTPVNDINPSGANSKLACTG